MTNGLWGMVDLQHLSAACNFPGLESIWGAVVEKETKEDDKTNQRYDISALKRI